MWLSVVINDCYLLTFILNWGKWKGTVRNRLQWARAWTSEFETREITIDFSLFYCVPLNGLFDTELVHLYLSDRVQMKSITYHYDLTWCLLCYQILNEAKLSDWTNRWTVRNNGYETMDKKQWIRNNGYETMDKKQWIWNNGYETMDKKQWISSQKIAWRKHTLTCHSPWGLAPPFLIGAVRVMRVKVKQPSGGGA